MAELKKRTIEKEFVPYDLALELRNLGFDDYVFAFYWTDTKQLILDSPDYSGKHNGVHLQAPLWQQAFRFFREKYNFHYIVYKNIQIDGYGYKEVIQFPYMKQDENNIFKTFEEAEIACIRKLIELAKNLK